MLEFQGDIEDYKKELELNKKLKLDKITYKKGDRIRFYVSPYQDRLYENSISGIVTEVNAPGRYTVKADCGIEYYVNESSITMELKN